MKNKYMPYIRKINGKEYAKDFRTAARLAFYSKIGGYVMVQRGFHNWAVLVGKTKRDIINNICICSAGKSFKQWARAIQKSSR